MFLIKCPLIFTKVNTLKHFKRIKVRVLNVRVYTLYICALKGGILSGWVLLMVSGWRCSSGCRLPPGGGGGGAAHRAGICSGCWLVVHGVRIMPGGCRGCAVLFVAVSLIVSGRCSSSRPGGSVCPLRHIETTRRQPDTDWALQCGG